MKPRFSFARFVDVFTPENAPSDGVHYAILVEGVYMSGHGRGHMPTAIQQAGAWLSVGKQSVIIAVRDVKDLGIGWL